MGVPDNSLLDLLEKVKSWISWGTSDLNSLSGQFEMADNDCKACCLCESNFKETTSLQYHCRNCTRMFCANCLWGYRSAGALSGDIKSTVGAGVVDIISCKFCSEIRTRNDRGRKYSEKIHPAESPRQSPEPQSPPFSGKRLDGYSPDATRSSVTSFDDHPSQVFVCHSPCRSDEEEADNSPATFFSTSSEFCADTSDVDSSNVSAGCKFDSFRSVGSSPSDSSSRIHFSSNRVAHSVQKGQGGTPRSRNDGHLNQDTMAVLTRPERGYGDPENTDDCGDDLSIFGDQCEELQKPLDFESNGPIWFPPPPEDEDDDAENNFFTYEDDEDEIGDSGVLFSSSSSLASTFPAKEKQNEGHKEPLRAVVQGHFRALVSQLLQGAGIKVGKEDSRDDWLDIVTTIAWQAANFVRPYTSRGGSMDPGDYVKVKCVASGSPSESTLVKGIVCTKNIKHKRMTSQYKNPRLLILGGALEYQRVPNQLSSFETLLQQEIDHLKLVVSKIEAHRPNLLLVEKSVSSYAQEYLLEKEISLVLNIKRPLLERIARCTGALITPSIDSISTTRLGHCELFRLERVSEELEAGNQSNKKISKTLMFFEGCPRRLGCTVLLKGSSHEELKKVKDVAQYAVFAAYHLSLETSFLADEGASLPKMKMKPSMSILERVTADNPISAVPDSGYSMTYQAVANDHDIDDGSTSPKLDLGGQGSFSEHLNLGQFLFPTSRESGVGYDACESNLESCELSEVFNRLCVFPSDIGNHARQELLETADQEEKQLKEVFELGEPDGVDENDGLGEYYSAADTQQSILVSFSSCCVLNGTVCERSQLRIKFYGCFDKPLGRYLQDDLFDQVSYGKSDPFNKSKINSEQAPQKMSSIQDAYVLDPNFQFLRIGEKWIDWMKFGSLDGALKTCWIELIPRYPTRNFVLKLLNSSDFVCVRPVMGFARWLVHHWRATSCRSCKEPVEAHVLCYTHQQGNLTINVRKIPSVKLPGDRDGKIWMWHRCLKCAQIDGVPPASRRVVMSDAAWGLSFGKFLELSFSNHATANRVASCGHSLQKDCLRYYGFGSMVAFFRYSPIDILSVHLPPSVLEFNGHLHQEWIRKETAELLSKTKALYKDLSAVLNSIERALGFEKPDASDLSDHIKELKELLIKESSDYMALLQTPDEEILPVDRTSVDILGLNCLRRSLVIGLHVWDRRLCSLDSMVRERSLISEVAQGSISYIEPKEWRSDLSSKDISIDHDHEDKVSESSKLLEFSVGGIQSKQQDEPKFLPSQPTDPGQIILAPCEQHKQEELHSDGKLIVGMTSLDTAHSTVSNLSDKIDSVWSGTDQRPLTAQLNPQPDGHQFASVKHINQAGSPSFRRLSSPIRVYSFDSALRLQERIRKGLSPTSLHLSTLRSFHTSGEYRNMIRDPVSSVQRSYSQMSPQEAHKLNVLFHATPSFISGASLMPEGARLLLPQTGQIVIAVYDNEPGSIISYAISSSEYEDWIADRPNGHEGSCSGANSLATSFSASPSFGSLDLDYIHYGSFGVSEEASLTISALFTDPKSSPHLRVSFEDESLAGGKVKFSVTCYFAKQFHALRKKCCPSEFDFVRSLSRCKRWSAQGGKSNAYFAKSLDERLIIKQVQKTELESFAEFGPEYFKHLTESLSSGGPTCLAKILGIYQVTVKHLKGGKEMKMDLVVMENLFFKRSISRVYDLKGSLRSRYNADTTGSDKVMLDLNLLETLRTKPILLGSKAKRRLERAVWNDTSFLASVDVMDYSLLVGVDDERKELVIGIIDFMRQYTWDKHLETWVKASGILGGPKNASPTIVSPKQYKKRFRKAMTSYFLTVPDQWSW